MAPYPKVTLNSHSLHKLIVPNISPLHLQPNPKFFTMSQTILLEQTVTSQSSITLKLSNNHSSNVNPSPTIDSKPQNTDIINDTDSKSDPEDQSFDNHASDDHAIRIHNVDSETEAAVNDFLRRNGSSDEEVRTAAMNDLRSFIEREEVGTETLLVLVKFAYDANNAELLDVFCQRVADVIKDMTVEEVREIFNITNDFTPEEEQEVRDEHPWAFES